ncbi:hypothetical protein ACS15_3985 [Ralstonia insidiosa]|uniref:Uncharacterized protein n=1 Tax=Ralstonia insidiosa TaxID=190721 RepID=A0AAC9FU67_9RALS|nr:hypothetical protein ACS15_3985 [Ralstonia insidiosa]
MLTSPVNEIPRCGRHCRLRRGISFGASLGDWFGLGNGARVNTQPNCTGNGAK